MKKIRTVSIIGAGSRGRYSYSPYAKNNPDEMKIVAVAEIKNNVLQEFAEEYAILKENCFVSAEEFFKKDKMSDLAFICTQDNQHKDHAIKALEKGYDLLLEKPMAITMEDCIEIVECANKLGRTVVVCHVLRYSPFFRKIKELIDSKEIGEIVCIHQTENVGYWHYAHSYVRGNWRNESLSSPMILAKCCHDLDIIHWLIGRKCERVSSYGSLSRLKNGNEPKDASLRCLDGNCKVKETCPYDCEKIYITSKRTGVNVHKGWPVAVLTEDLTEEGVRKALEEGPYGRCVYHCDNDVVDHQIVNMEFEGGIIASLSMLGLSDRITREIKISGEFGEITGDMEKAEITISKFGTEPEFLKIADDYDSLNGHGGGDHMLIKELMNKKDLSNMSSNINDSLHSHMLAFAAEISRKNSGKSVELKDLY